MQPVCLLLRPPILLPDMVGIPRAPPSASTEGLMSEANPPHSDDGAKNAKPSFHLSKIELFVKNKMNLVHFFSEAGSAALFEAEKAVGV